MKKVILLVAFFAFSLSLKAEEVSSFDLNGRSAANSINSRYNGKFIGYAVSATNRHRVKNMATHFSGGRIEVAWMQGFDFGNNFSVSLWARRTNPNDYGGIITNGLHYIKYYYQKDTGKTFEIGMSGLYGGKLLVADVNGKTGSQHVETVLQNNDWHHIVLTSDPYECKLYVDNHLVDNNLVNRGKTIIGQRSLLIGASGIERKPGLHNFDGDIDDVKIYNHILSESEVEALYKL